MTQENSTNPWIGWVFSLTEPNPGYGQSDTGELQQTLYWFGVYPNLTYGSAWQVEPCFV
jgi:hypothetical protein